MHCLILGVKRHFSPRLFVINLRYKEATVTLALAVYTLSGKSSIIVGQANVQAKTVDSRDNRTLTIEKVKVIDNLTHYNKSQEIA